MTVPDPASMMLAPYLLGEGTADFLRESMRGAPVPSVLVPDAVDAAVAADLRARVLAAELTTYALLDRGRYAFTDTLRVDPLWDELARFAATIAGAPVTLARTRWFRQRRGDYCLVKDDNRTRAPGRCVELALDVSSGMSGEAELVYFDGTQALAVPQIAGLLSVVDRSPTSCRYLRPPTCRSQGGHDVIRLILQFQ
jgi:hypothetical protein